MKDMGSIMKQAQAMQQKLQDAQALLAEVIVEGSAGAGLVKLTMSGGGELKGVSIDQSLLSPDEAEIVADLIVAAHADAKKKLDEAQARLMQEAMGPLAGMAGGMPGFPGMKF
jgi:DNA-binding YbaB/EbfC family protein